MCDQLCQISCKKNFIAKITYKTSNHLLGKHSKSQFKMAEVKREKGLGKKKLNGIKSDFNRKSYSPGKDVLSL